MASCLFTSCHCPIVQEDWGELNTGKKPPALFMLDLASWRVAPVGGLPPESSAGQPVWTPKGEPEYAHTCTLAMLGAQGFMPAALRQEFALAAYTQGTV